LKFKVELDPVFEDGELDTEYFKDFPNLSDKQLIHLGTFVDKVSTGDPLLGKNKPSWLDDNQKELQNSHSYKQGNYWHYHCGDFVEGAKVKSLTYKLGLNLNGLTSSSVIHYTKEDTTVVVMGYSPIHIPFPASDHPYRSNPLFDEEE